MTEHPIKSDDVSVRPDGDHVVIHLRSDNTVHRLNATAYAIWGLCDGTTSPEEIAEGVAELAGIDDEDAMDQVVDALDAMRSAGLIS
jgi:hypothetical protein